MVCNSEDEYSNERNAGESDKREPDHDCREEAAHKSEDRSFTFTVPFGPGGVSCEDQGTQPYAENPVVLPGRIEAEHYDVGCNGYAYSDLDNYNEGGHFRTDGVDIEIAYDEVQGYNIGWLRDGEWINYTIEVAAAGSFTFEFRVASAGDGSIMHVEVDGLDVTGPIVIAPTGSWQAWTTITKEGIVLEPGLHELRIAIDDGDFNLNYIDVD